MKTKILILLMGIISFVSLAQTPKAFNYQAVARDADGDPVINQNISVKIYILSGNTSGPVVYSELHYATSNSMGLFRLEIGNPSLVLSGTFEDIAWGDSDYFLKLEMDENSGFNFVYLGTSQLLSVPYALWSEYTANPEDADADPANELQILTQNGNEVTLSNGGGLITVADDDSDPINELQILTGQDYELALSQGGGTYLTGIKSYTQAEIDAIETYSGLTVHNSTTNCINYYYLNNWFEACGTCTPMPTQAAAGYDQAFYDETLTATLAANTPEQGSGLWSVVSGEGGSFDNTANPTTVFTGQPCTDYTLLWSISNSCGNSSDSVDITFFATPTVAFAGNDTIVAGGATSLNLSANTPDIGNGLWSVLSGEGGSFDDATNPTTLFTGLPEITYTMQWKIYTVCDTNYDEVSIGFYTCDNPLIDARDGQTYETVQIGEQCWMAENINIGTMINGSNNQIDDEEIEKYCYNNSTSNCDTLGGLYQWNEMMQYTTTQGVQGICMEGWHLPTDAEWCILEQEVDPAISCSATGYRGVDGGTKLKQGGNSGFEALLAGTSGYNGFFNLGSFANFWSSSAYIGTDYALLRHLSVSLATVYRDNTDSNYGFSVRCLQD